MAINHAITIPSLNNAPNPSGTPNDPDQDNPTADNPWSCTYTCTVSGHSDSPIIIWDGYSFSLPDSEANDPDFGELDITYDPPLV